MTTRQPALTKRPDLTNAHGANTMKVMPPPTRTRPVVFVVAFATAVVAGIASAISGELEPAGVAAVTAAASLLGWGTMYIATEREARRAVGAYMVVAAIGG